MEYLKLFDNKENYLAYRDDKSSYIKPNVSLCDGNDTVYYNYPPPIIVYSYVDLTLPSGTLWVEQNVGAYKPSDYGLYFQWGDTSGYTADQVGTGEGKKKFASDWSDYKWGTYPNFSKYTTPNAKLDLEDDAAHVNMKGSWHIPTYEQCQELFDNTTTAWTTSDGVSGMTFTSKKDISKSIFIPAAGFALNGSVLNSGSSGNVWAERVDSHYINYGLYFRLAQRSSGKRYNGYSIRGVIG